MTGLIQDLRLALRSVIRNPGFAAVVALSFALGIGGNALIFGLVDGFVLRPFPYPEPDRLVAIGVSFPRASGEQRFVEALSPAEYADIRKIRTLFGTAGFDLGNRNLVGGEYPERVFTALVLDDLFPVIGLSPLLGRGFTREELGPGGPTVAIVSHRLWRSRFGADPSLVGRSLEVSGEPRTVVGIMPPGLLLLGTDLWIPWGGDPHAMPRDARQFTVLGRLAEGVRLQEANAELATLAARVDHDHRGRFKEYEGWRLTAEPWASALLREGRPAALLLMGAVGLVLLIACANIASLLLARATVRQRDIAVRLALGARRWHVARQLLVESLVLAALGCGLGLFLADVGFEPVTRLLPSQLTSLGLRARLDGRVLGWSAAVTLISALLAGLLPLLQTTRADVRDTLVSDSRSATGRKGAERARQTLILGEIVLAVVLLAGAGLLIRSLFAIQRVDPGFDPRGVLTLRLTLPPAYRDEAITLFFRELIDRVARLPGVRAAGAASQLPPMGAFDTQFQVEGVNAAGETLPNADITVASREYLVSLGAPLVAGRGFSAVDAPRTSPVAVVNQAFASRYLRDGPPLGRRIALGGTAADRRWIEVIGVVADVRNRGLTAAPKPEIFVPMEQQALWNQLFLLIRADGDPRALLPLVRREVAALDPAQPVYAVQTLEDALAEKVFPQRAAMSLLSIFAAMAVALAAVGIYGLTSYAVDARTREFGIRMAVGADAEAVVRMVLGQVLRVVIAGALFGLGLAAVLARAASALLFEVSPGDPFTLGAVALSFGIVAAVAGWVPARRASRIDPSVALRHE